MSIGAVVGRLGAVALAILLVVGALVWRGRDDGAVPADPDATATTAPVADPGTVRCAVELGICDALADAVGDRLTVLAEDGVVTARSLQDAAAADVWVTLGSLVDVVAEGRDRASRRALFAEDPTVAGRSPLVLVGWRDRMAVLEQACEVSWACVGEVASGTWEAAGGQAAWGRPKPAHAAPDASGIGLLTTAQALASRLGDQPVTSRSLDQPDVRTWFTTLERAVPSFRPASGSQLVEMVQFGPASRDVVGTTEAEAADVLSRAGARAAELVVAPSAPLVEATAVVATPAGTPVPDGLADTVVGLLAARGWRVDGGGDGPTLPTPVPTPDGAPLEPSGGVLEAVLLRWEQVR